MKAKNNEINIKRLEKLKTGLIDEKLSHISLLLEYKFGISSIIAINPKEEKYAICVADEFGEICFGHNYDVGEIISCNAYEEAYTLRRAFCISIASDIMQESDN